MRLVALALVSIAGASQAQSTESAIQQGQRLADEVMTSWKSCLIEATDRYVHSSEKAEVVADVALNKCSQWDPAVKKTLTHVIAVGMIPQMPFDVALKVAEDDADNTLAQAKSKMKLNLAQRVMDRRLHVPVRRRRG